MEAYVYQRSLICGECATEIRAELIEKDGSAAILSDDQDYNPQGPYSGGGGEADTPQHCDSCCTFLENPLTSDGYRYLEEAVADKDSSPGVIREWLDFYGEPEE